MASIPNSFHGHAHSILSAIQAFDADILSRFTALGHGIKNAWIGMINLPSRLGNYITAVFHTIVNWICMILWKIGKVMLIFVATCVALLVLKFALKKLYLRWWRSSQPRWRVEDYRAKSLRDRLRQFETSTSDWRWYGGIGGSDPRQPAAREGFWKHFRAHTATKQDPHPSTRTQQHEEAQRQRASRQSRGFQSDSNRAASNERVRKQQAERKAAQAAQERRRNEEQEQRRADTRRKLSRNESERIYQRWRSSCDAAFRNPKLKVPEPPSFNSHVKDCKPVQGLRACTCDITRLLSAGSGPGNEFSKRQKMERDRWHPDRLHFTSRRDGGGPAWAQELHIAIKNVEVCKDW